LKRVLMGSVAEEVLREAVCPVLTVKPPLTLPAGGSPSQESALAIRTILHPTDLSAESDFAFSVACWLAEEYAARLILLHVIPPSSLPLPGARPFNPLETAEFQETVKGQFAWPQPANQRLSVEHRVAEGDPPQEILDLAQQTRCDLIVMGTQGRSGLKRVLLGSVAEEVLRSAGCPVLTAKTPPAWASSVKYSSACKPGEIVDVRPLGSAWIISTKSERTLLKTDDMEVVWFAIPEKESESGMVARGETVLQCLEGKVAFTVYGRTQILEPGNLLYLPKGESFTIGGIMDSALLLTVLLSKPEKRLPSNS
jgi:nucleotide-binding universal stress UspA family protein/quercetin dioxygenase-like cupin family protein